MENANKESGCLGCCGDCDFRGVYGFLPSMQSSGMQDLVNTKMNALPQDMMKILHMDSMADLTNIDAYFAYVFQYIFIAACVYAALIGAQALIKEETDGTIEFLYAQPITRSSLVFGK